MIASALVFSLLVAQSSPEPREGNRLYPQKLRGIPVGIRVEHHPNPCYPTPEGGRFVWRHDTTVQSLVGDLTLVEYGAYLYSDAGWRLRTTMTPTDFAQTYRCPGARLRRGKLYTDPDNARFGDKAFAGDALWYFLARDKNGKLYKGTELIETEGLSKSGLWQTEATL